MTPLVVTATLVVIMMVSLVTTTVSGMPIATEAQCSMTEVNTGTLIGLLLTHIPPVIVAITLIDTGDCAIEYTKEAYAIIGSVGSVGECCQLCSNDFHCSIWTYRPLNTSCEFRTRTSTVSTNSTCSNGNCTR
jgi:hypothetical protein